MSVMAIARQSRIPARAGVHIGEFDINGSETPLLIAAATTASAADWHGVTASRAVIDLLAGAGISFDDRGQVTPAGSRPLSVFAVRQID
jgi:hypothetical protein